jgi:FAD/FMN-containing dehydrogenase
MEKELIDELKHILEGDVESSKEVLDSHSTDYSIFKITPTLVVFPRHSGDIQKLVLWMKNKKESGGYSDLSLTVRAAGTCMSGGSLNESIIVDTTRYMSGVISVTRQDLGFQKNSHGKAFPIAGLARVLPGTYYRDFEKETLEKGLQLPCFPASKNLCAVGGMVANNGAGEKTLKYGQNKDFVAELQVVFADGKEYTVKPLSKSELDAKIIEDTFEGRLYRSIWNIIQRNREDIHQAKPKTSKNSSGYFVWDVWNEETQIFDLTKLIVGAQGTTGIITEITYKLVPVESYSNLLVMFLQNSEDLPRVVKTLDSFDVETMEVYDKHTFTFAVKFFRDFLKDKGIFGIISYFFHFLPEIFLVLTGGVPKFVVLVEFVSNDKQEIKYEIEKARKELASYKKARIRVLEKPQEIEKYWNIRRDSFKLLSDHSKKLRTAPFIDDVVIPVEHYPEYLARLTKLLDSYKLLYTIAGHLGNGNLHVIPLMDFNNPKTKEIILKLSPIVYEMVKEYGGSMTAEHNDGLVRTPFLPLMFGETMVGVFREVKEAFDERYMFNPKKKVGGTFADVEHFMIEPRQN